MNLSNKFWARFQDNIVAIISLTIFQISMTIMFPGHAFLGPTGNTIMQLIYGIFGILALIWIFLINNNTEFALDWLFKTTDDSFEKSIRWVKIISFAMIYTLIPYYFFRIGLFNYSKLYYIMMYANGVLIYYFLYQATKKRKKEFETYSEQLSN